MELKAALVPVVLVLVLVFLILVGIVAVHLLRKEGFQLQQVSHGLLTLKPTLWWIVEDETNARSWWDFGARNSRRPNRGYLEVALQAAQATQGRDFEIVPLMGRAAVQQLIMEAGEPLAAHVDQLPAKVWRQWAVANVLATKGGLVMLGDSTLCIGPSFGPLVHSVEAAMFGITAEEPRAIPGADVPPANWVGWATKPHHPVWDIAAGTWNRVANAGPTTWSAAEARRMEEHVWSQQALKQPTLFQGAEGSRKVDGTQLTAEDFLGKQVNPLDPKIALSPDVVYVPMDGDALVREYRYSWFVRMSKTQLLESNFYWAVLAAKAYASRGFKPVA
jgi:hypothetical protein